MGKKVFEVFKQLGGSSQVYLVPVAAPAGAAATYTFTAVGTPSVTKDLVIKIAGRTINVPVNADDAIATVATAITNAINARLDELPGTAAAALGVSTFTCGVNGVNGNAVAVEVVSQVAGVVVTAAAGVTGSGAIDITTALDALGSRNYQSIAISNNLAADITDIAAHMNDMWGAGTKRFRHAFVGERGSLGTATTLANGAQRKDIVVASYEGSGSLPGEIAAAVAAMRLTKEKPSQNWDGTLIPLYPPTDALAYIDTEVETALAGGVTPLTKSPTGFAKVERLVTTQTQDSAGNPFENMLDLANSYTLAYYGLQADIAIARAIKGKNLDSDLIKSLFGVVYSVLLLGEDNKDLHNVEAHKGELQVDVHNSLPTRLLVDIPCAVVPNAHQADATMRLIIEGAQ
jgi:phage tail sheath gpL-like